MFGGREWKQGQNSIGFWFSQLLLALVRFWKLHMGMFQNCVAMGFFKGQHIWKHL